MEPRKCTSSAVVPSLSMAPHKLIDMHGKTQFKSVERASGKADETKVDIDLREVYFLILHFLSIGPCKRTFTLFMDELMKNQLLPRRYHAWYSRSCVRSGEDDDDGISLPLEYAKLVERYPHIQKDHLEKLLKQLVIASPTLHGDIGRAGPNAADVPTLLGTGSYSLLDCDKMENKPLPAYLRWPHMHAGQIRGLGLREIGGGFTKHHRAPSIRSACYAIAEPSTMLQKMQNQKKIRGHRNAVYCAIFDRIGRYVITGSDDRLVKIWSTETALCLASCRGHEGDITDLAVNYNNAVVASASNDFVIRVWRLPDGMPVSVLQGHTGAVTAIAFSPRPSSIFQLLSSSDDGTCRIWDARSSQCKPRVFQPKPVDTSTGKSNCLSNNGPSSINGLQTHQILCCAYNASGTVFVTGSSDTFARVWCALKSNTDNTEQPIHEMDVLAGHENDVNYVQFSGCAVASKPSQSDTSKEDNIPKFRNSWFHHDNIVTCSRDGSAIIWVPRSRRSHGKVGRWKRAYHLKVPPPPLPPQTSRGGPRQRILPTPRGVNMIVWSLDNRFVLAAIMDCRICVWNAVDGSLVHCLTGHTASSFVLDVHPFNPRIAMSAGYDGKTIVWDIWEGTPIRTYDMGHYKLVDGNFSADGTSIVLSDDVGQIYLINTGEGEYYKDAKYDQFFLGDFHPVIRDTSGNILDRETQLLAYQRNWQDPLCDSSLIPYPEPYQTTYQKRRLGALGMEWRPSTINFAIGPDFSSGLDFPMPMPPLDDFERLFETLEFTDAMLWEPENDVISEEGDPEYNDADENSSEGRQGSVASSLTDSECSSEEGDAASKSRRKKNKGKLDLTTSSRKRVKKRSLYEPDGSMSGNNKSKKPKTGRKVSKRKSSKAKTLRPQRVAARNARNMLSQISETSSGGEDEYDSENDSSDSGVKVLEDMNIQSNESYGSLQKVLQAKEEEPSNPLLSQSQSYVDEKPKLILRFQLRDSKKQVPLEDTKPKGDDEGAIDLEKPERVEDHLGASAGDKESSHLGEHNMKWGSSSASVMLNLGNGDEGPSASNKCTDELLEKNEVANTKPSKEDTSRKPLKIKIKTKSRDPKSPSKLKFVATAEEVKSTGDDLMPENRSSSSQLLYGFDGHQDLYNDYGQGLSARNMSDHPVGKLPWLMLSEYEESYRYIPQLGDEVVYLRQGHQEFTTKEEHPRSIRGHLSAVEICKVEALEYAWVPGSGDSCCKLRLKFIDPSSRVFGKAFTLNLPELIDFSDFVVEKTWYDAAISKNWSPGDKCWVWWRDDSLEGGKWWHGKIVSSQAYSPEFPDSPWLRYEVRYKDDPRSHQHCPWEMHDRDILWEHPHIDSGSRDKLLHCFSRLEKKDYDTIQLMNQAVLRTDFCNRTAVPLYPELIKSKLKNNYYRTLEAVKHDIEVMFSNARAYFVRRELPAKIVKLSDWLVKKLSRLQRKESSDRR
ncbi:hypothetical protein UlMin_030754 [Ulmus minor]